MDERLKKLTKYIKSKYPGRSTLKMSQVADELLMERFQIKTLKESGRLTSFSPRAIAKFVIANPPRK